MLSVLSIFGVVGNAIAAVGKWLIANPIVLLAAVVMGSFAFIVISKNHEIDSLNTQINDPKTGWIARYNASEANNVILRNNNATLTNSLNVQSASIKSLADQGNASSAKFDQIIMSQASTREKLDQQSAKIDSAKPGIDKCQSASDLVRSMSQ